MHGRGVMITGVGTRLEGLWQNDILVDSEGDVLYPLYQFPLPPT